MEALMGDVFLLSERQMARILPFSRCHTAHRGSTTGASSAALSM